MLRALTFLFLSSSSVFERIFIAVSYLTFEIVIIHLTKFSAHLCVLDNYVWCLVNCIYFLYGLQL